MRSFIWDPEVFSLGPGTEAGARRRWFPLDPEIVSGPWCIWTLRSCGDPEAFVAMLEPGGLDPEIAGWNPEEPEGSSLDPEILLIGTQRLWGNPEAMGEPRGTVLRLPRQDYYRKSLTGFEGAGVGVMTQVPGLCCFPPRSVLIQVLFTLVLWGPQCVLGCTGVLGSFESIPRLAHTHSCFMSHTRFDSLWACHCGRATFVRVGQDWRSLET
ncbi:hypothetical protein F2Q69_00014127 [Brassica cretica]|uniref:Uncharacterized protein n=1 Tax=Brassica cretica TaxID=69181 RepID=A0A8S9R762_BRACR|nr:hypothetical protein F2Q69_00014127 [Brassica cretica]